MLWKEIVNKEVLIDFQHRQSAHCESGVISNLLNFQGIDCSEALAFGIGEGIFFGYLPFIKIDDLPLTTYRVAVGKILSQSCKRLNVKVKKQKFKCPIKATEALDRNLDLGIPTGCQTGAYWLPYFPPAFRFHFNMHNLVVIGRRGDTYIISDPVFNETVECSKKDLIKARFAKGALAPSGNMYHVESVAGEHDKAAAIRSGIKATVNSMLRVPVPILGVKGINFLANRIEKWPKKLGAEQAKLYLGQLIRMQEEIGTGGGGFRFMYAAFLQEAAKELQDDRIVKISDKMTEVGDMYRIFATLGARVCKGRYSESDAYEKLAEALRKCAENEKKVYQDLKAVI